MNSCVQGLKNQPPIGVTGSSVEPVDNSPHMIRWRIGWPSSSADVTVAGSGHIQNAASAADAASAATAGQFQPRVASRYSASAPASIAKCTLTCTISASATHTQSRRHVTSVTTHSNTPIE